MLLPTGQLQGSAHARQFELMQESGAPKYDACPTGSRPSASGGPAKVLRLAEILTDEGFLESWARARLHR